MPVRLSSLNNTIHLTTYPTYLILYEAWNLSLKRILVVMWICYIDGLQTDVDASKSTQKIVRICPYFTFVVHIVMITCLCVSGESLNITCLQIPRCTISVTGNNFNLSVLTYPSRPERKRASISLREVVMYLTPAHTRSIVERIVNGGSIFGVQS